MESDKVVLEANDWLVQLIIDMQSEFKQPTNSKSDADEYVRKIPNGAPLEPPLAIKRDPERHVHGY